MRRVFVLQSLAPQISFRICANLVLDATIEVIIEAAGFNNSLAGYDNCKNAYNYRSSGGHNATREWYNIYLQNATSRFQSMISGYDWTVADTYAAQTMCPYETVRYTITSPTSHELTYYRLLTDTVSSAIFSHMMNGLHLNILLISPLPEALHFNPLPVEQSVLDMFRKLLLVCRTIPLGTRVPRSILLLTITPLPFP